jgi:uncharacterized cupin superfamily protein
VKNNKLIDILKKYDFVRPADREVIKANIASKERVYKKIIKQESGWSFGFGFAWSLFSALRNYGFSVSMSTARRLAQVSLVAASVIVIFSGTLTLTKVYQNYHAMPVQTGITSVQEMVPLSGMISFTAGNVTVEDSAGNTVKAEAGDVITQGMKITTTGKKSAADIYVGENAFRVAGDTIVHISGLTTNPLTGTEQVSINLDKGVIYNRISRKLVNDDLYTVSTGTAVASVRGTEFAVEYNNDETVVSCLKGNVAVKNNDGAEIIIGAEEEASVTGGKNPVKSLIDKNRLNRLKILSDIKAAREDIRKRFEEQRAEIKQAVSDQKNANTENIEDRKSEDADRIEKVKAGVVKTDADKKATEEALDKPVSSVKEKMEALKKKPKLTE